MDINEQTLKERIEKYNSISGIRVGDWVREKDGKITRATHDWESSIQVGGSAGGQFYLGEDYISYSGGLDPAISKNKLRNTGETKDGKVWFFRDNIWGAGRGIDFVVPFRVFEVTEV